MFWRKGHFLNLADKKITTMGLLEQKTALCDEDWTRASSRKMCGGVVSISCLGDRLLGKESFFPLLLLVASCTLLLASCQFLYLTCQQTSLGRQHMPFADTAPRNVIPFVWLPALSVAVVDFSHQKLPVEKLYLEQTDNFSSDCQTCTVIQQPDELCTKKEGDVVFVTEPRSASNQTPPLLSWQNRLTLQGSVQIAVLSLAITTCF